MATTVFTDEQINSIMELINATRHTQYIGARYVPIFGRKGETSIEWDNTAPYEPLTIVLHQGNSYTSRQYVPTGVDILNEDFWANTGNYNAQIEQYRRDAIAAKTTADNALQLAQTNEAAINTIGANVTQLQTKFNNLNVINFIDYKTDENTDDETLDTILALPNINGTTLYFPSGTYTFNTQHTLPTSIKIIGQGDSTTIKWANAIETDYGTGPFMITNGDGIEISNLSFGSDIPMPTETDKNVPAYNFYLVMVAQDGSKNIYLHDINCKQYMLLECGIPHIDTTTPNSNITVANITAGHWTSHNAGAHDITSAVVEIYNTNNWRVTGCTFINDEYYGGGCGIQCWGGNSIDAATFTGGGTWLHNFAIDHNTIGHTQWSPIYTACAADGYIVNNICSDSGDGSLSIEGAKNVVIANNTLRNANNYLMALANAMCNVIVTGNVFTQSGDPGRMGTGNAPGTTPRKRFRMVSRWGIMVNQDTSMHQSLTIANNTFTYNGNTATVADGATCGTLEIGNDSGTLTFENNQLLNCFVSTFPKIVTGTWGIADFQLRYFRPCKIIIKNNNFLFDNADTRVAQENSPLLNTCLYVSTAFATSVDIIGNTFTSKTYALTAAPMLLRNIYVTRTSNVENYDEEKRSNAGIFIVKDNNIFKFENIMAINNSSDTINENIIFKNNYAITSNEWKFNKLSNKTTNIFYSDCFKNLYKKDTNEILYVEPLINNIPAKGSTLDTLLPTGVDLTFFGTQTLGGTDYHTITKRSGGWQGVGPVGPIVSNY